MKSVADDVRAETRVRVLAMSPEERLDLALRLGDEDVRSLSEARRVNRQAARLIIRQQQQRGRTPYRCLDDPV